MEMKLEMAAVCKPLLLMYLCLRMAIVNLNVLCVYYELHYPVGVSGNY